MTRKQWALLVVGVLGLGFRLDEPPPEPVELTYQLEDSVVPLTRPPNIALVAPAAGAPIVVEPGASFWVDMVLRIPLTPPPGIQQERALNSFEAIATGFADVGERPVVPLPVTKIRPSRSSTLYRAIVELPAWMPTGVWDLSVSGRGFDERVPRALVVRRGPVGLVTLGHDDLVRRARAAALSGALVAVVPDGVATQTPAGDEHTRWLDALAGIGLATVVRPSAADRADGAESFRRWIGPLAVRGPAIADGAWTDRALARDVDIGEVAIEDGAVVNRGPARARVTLRATTTTAAHLAIDGTQVAPRAVALAGTFAEPVVVRDYEVDVPAGERRRFALAPATGGGPNTAIELDLPLRADIGDAVTLRSRRAGPRPAATAWSFGDETFGAGERVRHRFTRLGRHDVELLRAGPDGTIARGRGHIRVDTAVRSGCASAGPGVGRGAPILPAAALSCLIWVWRRRGNGRPPPNVRSTVG